MLKLKQMDVRGKRVLIRTDMNVPVREGRVTSSARIEAALPAVQTALEAGAAVIVMSHLGRPAEGRMDPACSLAPVADELRRLLGTGIRLETDWIDGLSISPGEVVVLENVRFQTGEKANDETLARKMAALADVLVFDAFATAHRAQASTEGLIRHAEAVCIGPLLERELDSLDRALENPARPMVAVVGGAKVSTKLGVLEALMDKVDQLIVGGGMANTFLAAAGLEVGRSLYEPELLDAARILMQRAQARGAQIPLPTDVVVADRLAEDAQIRTCSVREVGADEMILDVGPETAAELAGYIRAAGTVLWNGPVGVFELEPFAAGTAEIAAAVADCTGFTLAGGGDTIAAMEKFSITDKVDYISTAGGAFLEYVEGKELPVIRALRDRGA